MLAVLYRDLSRKVTGVRGGLLRGLGMLGSENQRWDAEGEGWCEEYSSWPRPAPTVQARPLFAPAQSPPARRPTHRTDSHRWQLRHVARRVLAADI